VQELDEPAVKHDVGTNCNNKVVLFYYAVLLGTPQDDCQPTIRIDDRDRPFARTIGLSTLNRLKGRGASLYTSQSDDQSSPSILLVLNSKDLGHV
jgi:hypothetical protein